MNPAISTMDSIQQFGNAMQEQGIEPPDNLIADGELHRFGRKKSAWYVLHADNLPAGAFGDWSKGGFTNWRADIGRSFTPQEEIDYNAIIEAAKVKREAEKTKEQYRAADTAARKWDNATPCDTHPYLTKKGVKSHGLRASGDSLLIPAFDGKSISTLQSIDPNGGKLFHKGGKKSGCYFVIGEIEGAADICIAEGYATGATIHEATGLPVVIAFDAGNLLPVAKKIHRSQPDARLIICADDDHTKTPNAGIEKASKAAKEVCGVMVKPEFGENRPEDATDFNDMAKHCGMGAACDLIKSHVTGVTHDTPNNGEACSVTPENIGGVTDVTSNEEAAHAEKIAMGGLSIPVEERPCYKVFNTKTRTEEDGDLRAGVWYFSYKPMTEKTPATFSSQWVCSPLHVEAVTHDQHDNNFGRMLRFKNTNNGWRKWAMPMELLKARGDEMRGELLSMGVQIDPKAHTMLTQYLQALTPMERVLCALQVGWCGNNFVLPDAVYGDNAGGVIFQSGERAHDEYTTAGTLKGWQDGIASLAIGNPLFMVALSGSFAGALLKNATAKAAEFILWVIQAQGKAPSLMQLVLSLAARILREAGAPRLTAWRARRRCLTTACWRWMR